MIQTNNQVLQTMGTDLTKNAQFLIESGKAAFRDPFRHGASTLIVGSGIATRVALNAGAGIGGVAQAFAMGALGGVGATAVMFASIPIVSSAISLTGRESAITGAAIASLILMLSGGVVAAAIAGNSIGLEQEFTYSMVEAGLKTGFGGVIAGAGLSYICADVITPAIVKAARHLGFSQDQIQVIQAAVPNAVAAILEELDNLTE